MDLSSMVWFLGVCLATQWYQKHDLEGHLGANVLGQGAKSVVPLMVKKMATSNAKAWHDSQQVWVQTLEKIRAQYVVE